MLAPVADPADIRAHERPMHALSRRWEEEALRRGARWFGIACTCLPVLDLVDSHSVVDAVLAGLSTGTWPGVPLRVWAMLLWVVAAGAAAGCWIGKLAPGPRMRLFAVCALLHGVYAIAGGSRLTAIVAMACFAYSFVTLQGARET